VAVEALTRDDQHFRLQTTAGPLIAETVVLCTGAYQRPHRPVGASSLPADLFAIDVEDYRNPASLPDGPVLIVGSGQSGCQLAEELQEAGREVVIACGRAPWMTRRIAGRDFVWWVVETGFWNEPLSSLTSPEARLFANVLASGHGGGHDLHLRTLQARGIRLAGHFLGAEGGRIRFAEDLEATVAWGDQRYNEFADLCMATASSRKLPAPDIPPPAPFHATPLPRVGVHEIGSVIFAGGFRPDYERWVRLPGAFDSMGFPLQADGASLAWPGLYFLGVHFLRKRQSSLLYGVGEDAAIVAGTITNRLAAVSRRSAARHD
jgi:putative flavoprotein involved in K+ transport